MKVVKLRLRTKWSHIQEIETDGDAISHGRKYRIHFNANTRTVLPLIGIPVFFSQEKIIYIAKRGSAPSNRRWRPPVRYNKEPDTSVRVTPPIRHEKQFREGGRVLRSIRSVHHFQDESIHAHVPL